MIMEELYANIIKMIKPRKENTLKMVQPMLTWNIIYQLIKNKENM